MAYHEGIAEWFEAVSKTPSKKAKISKLRREYDQFKGGIVNMCFNPNIKFLLPEGRPPFKPQPKEADVQGVLPSNFRKFHIFLGTGNYKNLKQRQREQQFIIFLETMDKDDAELVLAIKDKKMPYRGLNRKLFEEAYPAMASMWGKERGENGQNSAQSSDEV